jgi:hypothetical protein
MGRTDEFNAGTTSIDQNSSAYNDSVPHDFKATSVLQPYIQSANGMASSDGSRRLVGGGMLPSANGVSQSTYEAERPITNNRISATS